MGRTLDDMVASLPAAQRRAVRARAQELIAEELTLRDLRKALNLTQSGVAAVLHKRQDEVSRLEQRGDMLLSTLSDYVRSLGGELELVCRFEGRAPIRLKTAGATTAARSRDRAGQPLARPRARRRARLRHSK